MFNLVSVTVNNSGVDIATTISRNIPLTFLLTFSGQPTDYRSFLTDSSFLSYRQSLVFVSYCVGVDAHFPVRLQRLNKM